MSVAPPQKYRIRAPGPAEAGALAQSFEGSLLGPAGDLAYIGAFADPGGAPLGAVAWRAYDTPDGSGGVGFQIFVRPEVRRGGVGRNLMQQLYSLAEQRNAGRVDLAGLIHQDSPDNAFYLAVGMTVMSRLRTYVVTCERIRGLCDPIVSRARERGHAHLADTRIASMNQVNLRPVAEFIATHYGGFVDQRMADLTSGSVDLEISQACVAAGGQVVGAAVVRAKPGVPSVMLDLILTAPAYRDGPLPLALIGAAEARVTARGISYCVFEGDEQQDRFAVGFAKRCDAEEKWCRYSYARLRVSGSGGRLVLT